MVGENSMQPVVQIYQNEAVIEEHRQWAELRFEKVDEVYDDSKPDQVRCSMMTPSPG